MPQSGPNFSRKFSVCGTREALYFGVLYAGGQARSAVSCGREGRGAPQSECLSAATRLKGSKARHRHADDRIASGGSGRHRQRLLVLPRQLCSRDDLPELRSGIIALLDKSVDASTRRMLVRRDVEEFEKTCAAVDPDATAAFKSLLAAEKSAAAPVAAPAVAPPKVQRTETTPPKEAVRKPEPRPQVTAKPPAANSTAVSPAPVATAPVASEPAKRDAAVSDTQWLEAVRQALVTNKPKPLTSPGKQLDLRPTEGAKPQPIPAPVVRPVPQENTLPPSAARPVLQETASPPAPVPSAGVPAAASPTTAPALPPPIAVAPPSVRQVDTDHPVPPEAIPDPIPPANVGDNRSEDQGRSRAGKWISNIPLLGPVIDNARR